MINCTAKHTKHELRYVLFIPGVTLIYIIKLNFIEFEFHIKLMINTGLFILLRIDVSATVGMSATVGEMPRKRGGNICNSREIEYGLGNLRVEIVIHNSA